MKVYTSKKHPYKNLLILLEDGSWGEITPLPGRSTETVHDILAQGFERFPVAQFGLLPLPQQALSWPAAALFMGTLSEILARAEKMHDFTYAKLKVGNLSFSEGVEAANQLKNHFRLRIDFNGLWQPQDVRTFCDRFMPTDFDYLEDPGIDVHPFVSAADDLETKANFRVWKPSVLGIPVPSPQIVLSSAFETGIGTARLVQLAHHLHLAPHPIGLGTYHYLEEDLLKEPLEFKNGRIYVPESLQPDLSKLALIR